MFRTFGLDCAIPENQSKIIKMLKTFRQSVKSHSIYNRTLLDSKLGVTLLTGLIIIIINWH